jgi:hypothetical protein
MMEDLKMKKVFALMLSVIVLLFVAPAWAITIDEINVAAVDTMFDSVTKELEFFQKGVTVVLEKPGNIQDAVTGATFQMWSFLTSDNSSGGQVKGDFSGGGISILDPLGHTLLQADINSFSLEESTSLPFTLFTGGGDFDVTGGAWAADFGPKGLIFDLTWEIKNPAGTPINIADFSNSFLGESDVTLKPVPEPATMILFGSGLLGLAGVGRRRKLKKK